MNRILFFSTLVCLPLLVRAQDSINPYVIQQTGNIILTNTDVYYKPFAPPNDSDTRANLCNLSVQLRDPDGLPGYYYPIVYDTFHTPHQYKNLSDWAPHGITIGNQVPWQRLFQGDTITAGGQSTGDRVIISKNEDVDFRATGVIKLKSGFHAMPGCFFHAYTAPKFDTAVFTDDFDSTKFDRSKWYVSQGAQGYNYGIGNECSTDSNISMDTDYQARDGHALDIVLREESPYCDCLLKGFDFFDSLAPNKLSDSGYAISDTFAFSTAIVHSYKFPFQLPWYHNFPYGKYEVRDKVPIVEHHLNNWGSGAASEWDLCEKVGGGLFEIHSGISHKFLYGPFKGKFAIETFGAYTDTTFRSEDAHWSLSNNPGLIIINGFSYEMGLNLHHPDSLSVLDTFLTPAGLNASHFGIPSSLKLSRDSFSFYYTKNTGNVSDTLPWQAKQDANGKWRALYAPYRYLNGDTLKFTKAYQPNSITLHHVVYNSLGKLADTTVSCHWDHTLNTPPDTGYLLLGDTSFSLAVHSGDTEFMYSVDEGPDYPVPPIAFDTTKYQYHTYTMELLPHEMRILVDGNVRLRFPDRLIPPNYPQYDYISKLPRAPMDAYVGEFDIDGYPTDPLGTDTSGDWDNKPVSITHQERKYFEWADTLASHGCWDVKIPPVTGPLYHAAHHLIDYIDILDLPEGAEVPKYPN